MVEMSSAVETQDIQINPPSEISDSKESVPILTNGASTESSENTTLHRASRQYSREEMLILEKSDLALLRPEYLNTIFDREGRWDPMAWHCGNPHGEPDTIPVGTLEFRKRTNSNAADRKDVEVILSPQRMSFGNGCAGSKVPPTTDNSTINNNTSSNNKRLNGLLPKNKFDKNSERTRDPDREKHLQKINGSYSGNREQIRKAIRDLHENRDKTKGDVSTKEEDELWLRNSEYSIEYKTYKDSKYNNSNGMMDRSSKRNWNPRHNSERSVDDEPEWFTSGPTSRLDTIELKGFEDDDKLHSTEATTNNDGKGRDDELAMDPLGNPEMTSTSNQYANESSYSTGLQEDWDPTHPKFNVDALLDPDAFKEGGKDLLEAEKSINLPNTRGVPAEFWAGSHNTSSPKEFAGQPRPNTSLGTQRDAPDHLAADVYFGESIATSNLKAMLGVNDAPPHGGQPPMMGMPPGPPPGHPMFDNRNGNTRPNLEDDPVIRQLLQNNDKSAVKQEMLMRPELLAQHAQLQRNVRDLLLQRSQSEHLPPPGPMLPHPGPVMTTRHPVPDHIMRDPRLIDPRVINPRFNMSSPIHQVAKQGGVPPQPRNGPDLLKAVKNDPAQLDKVINCLQNALKMGNAPIENQQTMHALLKDMEKARNEHIKLQRFHLLTQAQQLNKHPDQLQAKSATKRHSYDLPRQQQILQALHLQNLQDKTQALKALLRLPGQGGPLMTAPARVAPGPMRPRGEENIPTRLTNPHDHRMMMKHPHGFPMAFTPTSVMIRSSEARNFGKMEPSEVEHNINLTPSHVQPPRAQFRSHEGPGVPNGRRSPRFDDMPKPVPTIETSRGGAPRLHFPPSFSGPMKGLHQPPPNFMMHQSLAKGIPPSPHSPHIPSQLLMQELMHSNKPNQAHFNHPMPPPVSIPNSNGPGF